MSMLYMYKKLLDSNKTFSRAPSNHSFKGLLHRIVKDQRGGFFLDSIKGAPEAKQANVLQPITSSAASNDYQRLLQAVALSVDQAKALNPALQTGIDAQTQALQGMQGVADGTGPNPAMAMLNNATGQNAAQTAAMMASGRGAGANAGLVARQAGMAGANAQQQMAGQAAELQANQQLNALTGMGQMGQGLVTQGLQGSQLGTAAATAPLNQLNAQNTSNIQNTSQQNDAAQKGYASSTGLFGTLMKSGASAMGGMAHGGKVPGEPKKPGVDSEENDTVPTMLTPGEIVIPLSFASDPKSASAFAYAVSMMHSKRPKG
jgi:hypothetical protein